MGGFGEGKSTKTLLGRRREQPLPESLELAAEQLGVMLDDSAESFALRRTSYKRVR
jgi:hypothetical protein